MMTRVLMCSICHFEVIEDDVAIAGNGYLCVCLGCYDRVTDTEKKMPKSLRRDVEDALRSEP